MEVGICSFHQLLQPNNPYLNPHTLAFKLHVRLLHDSKIGVFGEHLRPLLHPLQYFRLHLLVCILRFISVVLHSVQSYN